MGNECFKAKEERPRIDWVIGLDFGTTYSGFAYASTLTPEPEIHVYYDWPQKESEKPYSKTLTALFYKQAECSSWGYCARSDFFARNKTTCDPEVNYRTSFKLLLMQDLGKKLPPPFTTESLVTDYLRCIGEKALAVIENHEGTVNFNRSAIQWCVTVPSIWNTEAKQKMKECMVSAGLVPEPNAVTIALEPEAASFHCHQVLQEQKKLSLQPGEKLLVVDIGGGTVDIVLQEFTSTTRTFKVKEISKSSGGFYGGTFVDQSFMRFMFQKVGCLNEFLREYPAFKVRLLKDWEMIKCSFGNEMVGSSGNMTIGLHYKLAPKWEAYEQERGREVEDSSEVELTKEDVESIFDPMVGKILDLIAAQMKEVMDIKVMFVVGGFSSSPYLMQRIRDRFADKVAHIVSPPNPGSSVAHGAVLLALHPDSITSNFKDDYCTQTN